VEFVNFVRANPGRAVIGHSGLGSAPQIMSDMFEKFFNVNVRHIPYNSSADAVTAIVAGDIDAHFCQATPALSHIRAGSVRLSAMLTDDRTPLWPDVPTVKEFFPDFDNQFIAWGFIATQKDAPTEVINFLRDIFDRAVVTPEFEQNMRNLNQAVPPINSRNMVQFVRAQYELYLQLLR
jgi:tripartite-type tricarboxylate transporter receptor subunit TctC